MLYLCFRIFPNAETYFEETMTSTGSPVAFLATGLPGGITIDPTNGNLSGTPVRAGDYHAEIKQFILITPLLLRICPPCGTGPPQVYFPM